MDTAPLNLAHFHERRADKHLRRNRYEEAIKAMETAMAYIEDAYKTISIPKAIQVLDAEKWSFSRKLKQITIRQSQYEGSRIPFIAQPVRQNDLPQATDISIHQAIENFDAKYTSSTLDSIKQDAAINKSDKTSNWMEELECKDFPCLAPLELPAFDIGFETSSHYEEQDK